MNIEVSTTRLNRIPEDDIKQILLTNEEIDVVYGSKRKFVGNISLTLPKKHSRKKLNELVYYQFKEQGKLLIEKPALIMFGKSGDRKENLTFYFY